MCKTASRTGCGRGVFVGFLTGPLAHKHPERQKTDKSDKLLGHFEVKDNNNLHDREREREGDTHSLPITLAFVYSTVGKKEKIKNLTLESKD